MKNKQKSNIANPVKNTINKKKMAVNMASTAGSSVEPMNLNVIVTEMNENEKKTKIKCCKSG